MHLLEIIYKGSQTSNYSREKKHIPINVKDKGRQTDIFDFRVHLLSNTIKNFILTFEKKIYNYLILLTFH